MATSRPRRKQVTTSGALQGIASTSVTINTIYPPSIAGNTTKEQRKALALLASSNGTVISCRDLMAYIEGVGRGQWDSNTITGLHGDIKAEASQIWSSKNAGAIANMSPAEIAQLGGAGGKNNQTLVIEHLATGQQVSCPGNWLSIEDQYSPTWRGEIVYGRMDPIVTYQNTKRDMRFTWEINTAGGQNMIATQGFNDIVKFLYPVYLSTPQEPNQMSASPLWRITLYDNDGSAVNYFNHTIVMVNAFTISELSSKQTAKGLMASRTRAGDFASAIVSDQILLNFGFTILHAEPPGFKAIAKGSGYEYHFAGSAGVGLEDHNYPYGLGSQQGRSANAMSSEARTQQRLEDAAGQDYRVTQIANSQNFKITKK